MSEIAEPDIDQIELTAVLQAVADEQRLRIIRELAVCGEAMCGSVDLDISKATRSHHFRVLRETGLTRTRTDGTRRLVSLRKDELDAKFPGLLDALLAAQAASTT